MSWLPAAKAEREALASVAKAERKALADRASRPVKTKTLKVVLTFEISITDDGLVPLADSVGRLLSFRAGPADLAVSLVSAHGLLPAGNTVDILPGARLSMALTSKKESQK